MKAKPQTLRMLPPQNRSVSKPLVANINRHMDRVLSPPSSLPVGNEAYPARDTDPDMVFFAAVSKTGTSTLKRMLLRQRAHGRISLKMHGLNINNMSRQHTKEEMVIEIWRSILVIT